MVFFLAAYFYDFPLTSFLGLNDFLKIGYHKDCYSQRGLSSYIIYYS